jgi:hypothetical protein
MDKRHKRTKTYLGSLSRSSNRTSVHLPETPISRDIFISHAAADKPLVDLFTSLLRAYSTRQTLIRVFRLAKR